jgi:hypothetical protein
MATPDPHGFTWRKSSYSAGSGDCIEVGETSTEVRVRDTKDRKGGQLSLGRSEWRALLAVVR